MDEIERRQKMAACNVANALDALNEAKAAFQMAEGNQKTANVAKDEAADLLNEKQLEFDAAVDHVKNDPPFGSAWHKADRRNFAEVT